MLAIFKKYGYDFPNDGHCMFNVNKPAIERVFYFSISAKYSNHFVSRLPHFFGSCLIPVPQQRDGPAL